MQVANNAQIEGRMYNNGFAKIWVDGSPQYL